MRLLEREQALAQLHQLLDEAIAGDGRLVLVGGEAGIGKTVLVQHFCQLVRATADVFVGACDPVSTPTPLGPLHDIAPALGGELDTLLRDSQPVRHIFGALLQQLTNPTKPRVVVLEDVHWADDATLDLMRFLARRLTSMRALLVATYREDEVGPRHPLRIALGDVASIEGVRRISLPALSAQAVATMAAGSGLNARQLHERTGGNPFFVSQVVAAPTAHVPTTVRDAMLARIARLSPAAQATLEAAAIVGPRVEPWLVERIVPGAADGHDTCFELGLLLTDGTMVVFRHELLREAVLETVPAHRQMVLQRLVLAALVSAGVKDADLARLAYHAEGAADRAAVLRFAPAAARRAAQLNAHREAAAQYARALRWADELDPRERAILLEGRGQECQVIDQAEEAIAAHQAAVDIWRQLREPEREGDNLRMLSRAYLLAGQNAQADLISEQSVCVLESLPPGPALAWALTDHSQKLMLRSDYYPAVAPAERGAALAATFDDSALLARATFNVGAAHLGIGDVERGLSECERAASIALQRGVHFEASRSLVNIGSMWVTRYQLTRAQDYIERGISYAREHDQTFQEHYMIGWLAVAWLLRGRWTAALELAEGLEATDRAGVSRINTLRVIGLVRARRGEPGAWQSLDIALELAEQTGELQRIGPVCAARAEVAWLERDLPRTADEARPAYQLFCDKQSAGPSIAHWYVAEPSLWLWRAGQLAPPFPSLPPQFALEMTGDWAAAAELWRQLECPYDEARALLDSDDVGSLRRALSIARELGALPLAARIVERLAANGARPASPRVRDRAATPGLSAREREVVGLIARGCTNRQIAEQLIITERTVESHVQSILNRLGVHSRVQVAAWAIQQGLTESAYRETSTFRV